ncbi:MAG: hypothetical protein O7H41_11995 [Planctomycetota bacterium]|nr:hypothetical protein [Planctomycetota bacterium]
MRTLRLAAVLPLVLVALMGATTQEGDEPAKLPLAEAAARVSGEIKGSILVYPGLKGEVKLPDRSLEPLEQVRFIADQVGASVWPFGTASFLLTASRPVKGIFEDAPVSRVLDEVSTKMGVDLVYLSSTAKTVSIEGRGDTALTFLERVCGEADLVLIRERGLILRFSTEEHEKRLAARPLADETLAALGLGLSVGKKDAVVSLDFAETAVSEIVALIAEKAGISIEVEERVAPAEISLRMKDAPWKDALEAVSILSEAAIWDDGKGVVSLRRIPRITMEFSGADTGIVLDLIARNAEVDLEISEELEGVVSLNLRNVAWRDAVYTLSRCHPFHLELSKDGKLVAKGM